jgi:cytoskeletal protein RodZ
MKQARRTSRISINELSTLTRIPTDVLTDIESDNFSSSGGLAYARGHIKSIAKALKADPEDFLHEFTLLTQEIERPMINLLEDSYAVGVRKPTKLTSFKTLALAGAFLAMVVISVPAASGFLRPAHLIAKPAVAAVKARKNIPDKTNSSSMQAPSTIQATSTIHTTKRSGATVQALTGDTWLSVTNNVGRSIFTGLLVKGSSRTFDDSQLIRVTIGNSGVVALQVDGKDVGLAGKSGVVLHLQIGPGTFVRS